MPSIYFPDPPTTTIFDELVPGLKLVNDTVFDTGFHVYHKWTAQHQLWMQLNRTINFQYNLSSTHHLSMGEWIVGAFINFFGSIAINFGTNLLKLGHDEVH